MKNKKDMKKLIWIMLICILISCKKNPFAFRTDIHYAEYPFKSFKLKEIQSYTKDSSKTLKIGDSTIIKNFMESFSKIHRDSLKQTGNQNKEHVTLLNVYLKGKRFVDYKFLFKKYTNGKVTGQIFKVDPKTKFQIDEGEFFNADKMYELVKDLAKIDKVQK